MLSLALTSIGTGLLLAGIVMWLKGRGNPEARHIGDGFAALGCGIYFVADVLSGVTISASIPGLFALWLGYQWWRNRRNGGWKRAARALGEKSRALVRALVERMTRSPIPSPGGAS